MNTSNKNRKGLVINTKKKQKPTAKMRNKSISSTRSRHFLHDIYKELLFLGGIEWVLAVALLFGHLVECPRLLMLFARLIWFVWLVRCVDGRDFVVVHLLLLVIWVAVFGLLGGKKLDVGTITWRWVIWRLHALGVHARLDVEAWMRVDGDGCCHDWVYRCLLALEIENVCFISKCLCGLSKIKITFSLIIATKFSLINTFSICIRFRYKL